MRGRSWKGVVRCYYKVLGVSPRASEDEIRRSFRQLALRYHPDRNPENPEAPERFREAVLAYETLIDRTRRRLYDKQRGVVGVEGKRRHRRGGLEFADGEASSYEELLEELFGLRRKGNSGCSEGRYDLRFDLQVHRNVMTTGATEEIRFQRLRFCPACRSGARSMRRRGCDECRGTGEIMEECSVTIEIPPGMSHESRLRIHGFGDCLEPGSAAGDLVVVVHFAE